MLKGAYNITFSLIDKGILEVAGPTGGGKLTYRLGILLARFQTGNVYDYAAFILLMILLASLAGDYSFLTTLLPHPTAFLIPVLTVKNVTASAHTLLTTTLEKARLINIDLDRSPSTFVASQARFTTRSTPTGEDYNNLLLVLYQNAILALLVLHFALLVRAQVHLDAELFLQAALQQNTRLEEAARLVLEHTTPAVQTVTHVAAPVQKPTSGRALLILSPVLY